MKNVDAIRKALELKDDEVLFKAVDVPWDGSRRFDSRRKDIADAIGKYELDTE